MKVASLNIIVQLYKTIDPCDIHRREQSESRFPLGGRIKGRYRFPGTEVLFLENFKIREPVMHSIFNIDSPRIISCNEQKLEKSN